MKKTLISIVAIFALFGCTGNNASDDLPKVKKEKIYEYRCEDIFGEIVPEKEPSFLIIREYDTCGLISQTKYDSDGEVYSRSKYTLDKDGNPIRLLETLLSFTWEYYLNDDGKWYKSDYKNKSEEEWTEIKRKEYLDYVELQVKDEIYYNGKMIKAEYQIDYTKYGRKGLWTECKLTEVNSREVKIYKRKVLEYL